MFMCIVNRRLIYQNSKDADEQDLSYFKLRGKN